MEVPLFAAHRLSRRTSRRNEFFQKSAGALGKRTHTNRHQAIAPNTDEQSSLEDQNRSVLPSHSQHFVSPHDCAFLPAAAGNDCEIQSRLVSDALYRPAL